MVRLLIYLIVTVCLLWASSSLYGQKKRSVEIYYNPFIYRGNVNNQFTEVNNKYVDGRYNTPYIFETGFNYKVNYRKWGWFAGISFMIEQQYFELDTYIPSEYYAYRPRSTFQFDFTSSFIGWKGGVEYSLSNRLDISVSLNIFDGIVSQSRFLHQSKNTKYLTILSNYNPSPQQIEDGYDQISAFLRIKADDLIVYSSYVIPEISLTYEILPNTYLTFGTRLKFWSQRNDKRFRVKVDGYFDNTDVQFDTFHESGITSQGIYTYLGLKYDIPLIKDGITQE